MTIAGWHRDGYYGDDGRWVRTKYCFVSCGARCTCRPIGPYYNPAYDRSKHVKDPPIEEDRDY